LDTGNEAEGEYGLIIRMESQATLRVKISRTYILFISSVLAYNNH